MAIKEGNSRIIITIPTTLKDKLDILCIKDKRTTSKEIEYILEQYLNSNED
jgi:metal-responsive CopG/Arc/MetJ family transcriptional regulator